MTICLNDIFFHFWYIDQTLVTLDKLLCHSQVNSTGDWKIVFVNRACMPICWHYRNVETIWTILTDQACSDLKDWQHSLPLKFYIRMFEYISGHICRSLFCYVLRRVLIFLFFFVLIFFCFGVGLNFSDGGEGEISLVFLLLYLFVIF